MRFRNGLAVVVLAAAVSIVSAAATPQPAQVPPAEFGQPFPAWSFQNLNSGAGGAERIDLAKVLGKAPVVFFYWMPGHTRSEDLLVELQTLVESVGPGKLVLYGVSTPPMGSSDTASIRERAKALKLRVPVLHDEGVRLAQQLRVDRVPAIALVDRDGKLRLTNGASLIQSLEYKMDLGGAIRRLASTGTIGTYGALPKYDPVVELVGKKAPEFQLPAVADGVPRTLGSLLASNKITVLVFWSVDCPHCKQTLPKMNEWVRGNAEAVNFVSIARVTNDALRTQTEEFARLNRFVFPTLLDRDFEVASKYLVTGTPTVLVLRPDGTIHSIMPANETDYDRFFGVQKREILKSGSARS